MKSIVDVSLPESYVSLPKLDTKNQIVFKKNALQKRISLIRESQENIQKLELMSQEFAKEAERNDLVYSFIQLPPNLLGMNSYNQIYQKDEFGKYHDNHLYNHNYHPQSNLNNAGQHHSQSTTHKKRISTPQRLITVNEQEEGATNTKKMETNNEFHQSVKGKKLFNSQSLQQNKFKKISLPKGPGNLHNIEEELFIKENWNDQQKYELQTGETLNFLFKNLAENLQNLVKYKSEKYCIKIIEKNVNYNRKLKRLIDITNTPFKEYNATLLLQRYFKILYKTLHLSKKRQSQGYISLPVVLPQSNKASIDLGMNDQIFLNTNTDTTASNVFPQSQLTYRQINIKEEPITPLVERKQKEKSTSHLTLVHDKGFLDNILDLNSRLEEWIMGMQKSQIQQFSTQLVDITEQVFEKELSYKNQLINHQKKQSYLELKDLIKNKYSLNLRAMKSSLSQQVRSCEDKNGDIKYVHRQNLNKGHCIDQVINCLEKLDLY